MSSTMETLAFECSHGNEEDDPGEITSSLSLKMTAQFWAFLADSQAEQTLTEFSKLAGVVLLIPSSSASSDRCFSLMDFL
jgi:hypothetical protein